MSDGSSLHFCNCVNYVGILRLLCLIRVAFYTLKHLAVIRKVIHIKRGYDMLSTQKVKTPNLRLEISADFNLLFFKRQYTKFETIRVTLNKSKSISEPR